MKKKNKLPQTIEELFQAKKEYHQRLARLPIEKKVEILVELQKIAVKALPKSKRLKMQKMVWKLS